MEEGAWVPYPHRDSDRLYSLETAAYETLYPHDPVLSHRCFLKPTCPGFSGLGGRDFERFIQGPPRTCETRRFIFSTSFLGWVHPGSTLEHLLDRGNFGGLGCVVEPHLTGISWLIQYVWGENRCWGWERFLIVPRG